MIFGLITVIGFMLILAIVGVTIMHYLSKGMVKHDADRIDPIPEKRY
ncbi:MAG: hypothetical protein ACE3JQ_11755 [Paenisporosarcina sp.]